MADRRMALLPRALMISLLCAAFAGSSLPVWSDDSVPPVQGVPPSLEALLQQKGPLEGKVNAEDSSTAPDFKMAEPVVAPAAPPAMPAPVMRKKPLEASVQQQQLDSDADQNGDNLKGMSPAMDKSGRKPLSGNTTSLDSGVTSSDPDMDDQEMQVQWDKWHNRVLNAIQQGLIEQLTATGDNVMYVDQRTGRMRSKYPLGTMAMFSCQITPDHRVINLKIEQTSGFADYDRAVYQSVKILDGSSILRYPKGSHRTVVAETAGIRTSMQAGPANFKWGDTEHYRVPANSY